MSPDFPITPMVAILIPGTGAIPTLATSLGAGRAASVADVFMRWFRRVAATAFASFGVRPAPGDNH